MSESQFVSKFEEMAYEHIRPNSPFAAILKEGDELFGHWMHYYRDGGRGDIGYLAMEGFYERVFCLGFEAGFRDAAPISTEADPLPPLSSKTEQEKQTGFESHLG